MNKSAVFVLLAGITWGLISIFVNGLADTGFNSLEIVSLRVLTSAIFLVVYALFVNKDLLKIKLIDIPYFIGTGVFSIVFFNFCYFETIRLTNSVSISALMLYTAPIFVMIMSALFFKEKITIRKIICLLITMFGLCFITGVFTDNSEISRSALICGLGSGFCYALYSIFGKKVTSKYDSITILIYTFILASFAVVPYSGIINNLDLISGFNEILYILGLAILCTITPFLFYTKGLENLDASKASVFATIEPITAVIVGLLIFGEIMTLHKFIGIVLILLAITILNFKKEEIYE